MNVPANSSFSKWYREGQEASYVRTRKSPGGILDLLEVARPAGDMSRPALPELVLYQDLLGGSRVSGDSGGGYYNVASEKGFFYLSAPSFANKAVVDSSHQLRSLSFPVAHWQKVLDEATDGRLSMECLQLYGGPFHSLAIQSALRSLWLLCDEEGTPSRLLAQAAGCEIMAELCRKGGTPFESASGGLAPWAEKRCLELMRTRLSEDICLNELAAEARLSPFHFARMFKQSVGVPPRAYLTRLRVEKACELLELTDLSVTEIAQDVGYSSNQVLARIFIKYRHMSPTDYRRAVRR
ncbi:Transcriptional regulator, AraC family [Halomonas citrativorans]|uniref:Transcriptional regulator, AraC family n=1 Tax=Halomonas citrativorans TaxID=2742612 RepID=A0A1R4HPW0_9GAMM|nr:AraC family transcriptional regulator [Halomonas citrativorans]SJN09556.1 Transcriptional regulator, AraC family [Halomonas citrativorans]